MKRFYCLFTLAITLCAMLLATGLPVRATMMTSTPTACSPAVLQGTYTFRTALTVTVAPGTVIALPEALLANSPVLLAGQGTVEFGEQGQAVLTATADVNGEAIPATAYPGSYTLDTSCNATITLANGVWFTGHLVAINGQPTLVSTTPGLILFNNW